MVTKLEAAVSKLAAETSMFLGAVAASALILFWGTGLHPVWWLTWLAPLPVLLVVPRLGAWPAFGASVLAWFLGSLNMWHYLRGLIHLPVALVLIVSALPACIFGLAVLLFRKFVRGGDLRKASLALPTLWVAYEYLNAVTSPHSTFGNLGYTQVDCLPVLQVVSLVGIWGISFCLFLLPATAAALLSKQGSAPQRRKLAATMGAFLAAVIVYGSWRLILTPAAEQSLKVGLVAMGAENPFLQGHGTASELVHDCSDQVTKLAAQGAQAILLPEKIAIVPDEKTAQFDGLFETVATAARSNIVVGLDRGRRHATVQ